MTMLFLGTPEPHSTGFLPAYRNGFGAIPRDKVRLGHGHGVSPGVEPLSLSKQDN